MENSLRSRLFGVLLPQVWEFNPQTLNMLAQPSSTHRYWPWAALLFLSCVWGSSFILIKTALTAFTPVQVGAFRISAAALTLLPFMLHRLRRVGMDEIKSKLPWLGVVGLVGNGIPAFLFALAQTRLESSTAGALNALTPMFTLLLGVWWFGMPINKTKLLGVGVGFSGALILILIRGNGQFDPNWLWAMLVVAATLMYGTSVNTVGRHLRQFNPLLSAAIPLALVAPFTLVILFSGDFLQRCLDPEAIKAIGGLALLSVLGSAISLVLFNRLIQVSGPVFASTTTYLMPLVALGWGWWDGELLGFSHLLGMGAILTGIWLIYRGNRRN
ncbi:MAG: DMT family transporter [Bacteroidia bacterium]